MRDQELPYVFIISFICIACFAIASDIRGVITAVIMAAGLMGLYVYIKRN